MNRNTPALDLVIHEQTVRLRLVLVRVFRAGGIRFVDQFRQGGAADGGGIVHKMNFWQGVDMKALAQLIAQETRCFLQTSKRIPYRQRVVDQRCEKYFRMCVVRGKLYLGQRDHTYTGIFDLHGDQLGQIFLDLVGDALTAAGNGFAVLGHEGSTFRKTLDSGLRQDDAINYPRDEIRHPDSVGAGDSVSAILESTRDFLYLEDFELIAFLDVVVVFE